MIPGRISEGKKFAQLKRISPSRYNNLRQCILREVLAASRVPSMLPSSPAARLGSVIHTLLEEAGKGKLPPSTEEIANQWDSLLSSLESKLADDPLDSTCVPFSKTVREYDLKRLRAIRKASQIALRHFGEHEEHDSTSTSSSQHEMWVESEDGRIGGAIDCVWFNEHGAVIRDYKTGQVFDGQEIKPDYTTQLKLYAALYSVSTGVWPVALALEPLSETHIDVPFTVEEAEALLEQAVDLLQTINKLIESVISEDSLSARITTLAEPEPKKCFYCRYRPVCGPYLEQRSRESSTEWPIDLIGSVIEMTRLANGRLLVGIATASGNYYARGITDSLQRHPALADLKIQDRAAIFGLLRTASSDTYSESSQTTIYIYDHEP